MKITFLIFFLFTHLFARESFKLNLTDFNELVCVVLNDPKKKIETLDSYKSTCETLIRLYYKHNSSKLQQFKSYDYITIANFCLYADNLDRNIDKHINVKDLSGLFNLVVVKQVPLNLLTFNKRCDNVWLDMRSIITTEHFKFILPLNITELKDSNMKTMKKIKRVMRFIRKNVLAVPDNKGNDFWQNPLETLNRKKGDCEDFAILLQSICEYLNIKTNIAFGRIVLNKKIYYHVWCIYGNYILDCSSKVKNKIVYNEIIHFNSKTM